jgi:septal ring factor EnvC (AmiA/AmiB activator)
MVDVDSALLSVQERDNWRRRMEVLEQSLVEVRDQRHKLELRLQRVRKELARLRVLAEAVVDSSRAHPRPEFMHGAAPTSLHNR